MTASSMVLQKSLHFLGKLWAYACGGSDVFDARFAQAIHGTKSTQQQVFSVLTHTGTIVQNAFFDAFFHQQLVISISKSMRLIANTLQ